MRGVGNSDGLITCKLRQRLDGDHEVRVGDASGQWSGLLGTRRSTSAARRRGRAGFSLRGRRRALARRRWLPGGLAARCWRSLRRRRGPRR